MATFENQLDVILKHEGKFQKWRQDRGNWFNGQLIGTKYGIVPRALAEHRGVRHITEAQMRALSLGEAKEIYRHQYYDRAKIGLLPPQIQFKVFDMTVNHGVRGGVKLLQKTIRRQGKIIDVDGRIGPQTTRLAYEVTREIGPRRFVNAMVQVRNAYYAAIIRNRPSQERFRRGWLRRSNSFTNMADVHFVPDTTITAEAPPLPVPPAAIDETQSETEQHVELDIRQGDGWAERTARWIIEGVRNLLGQSRKA